MKSVREQIREYTQELLRQSGRPMHNIEILAQIQPKLTDSSNVTAKMVNTTLHDDPAYRFERVGKGTWALRHQPT